MNSFNNFGFKKTGSAGQSAVRVGIFESVGHKNANPVSKCKFGVRSLNVVSETG